MELNQSLYYLFLPTSYIPILVSFVFLLVVIVISCAPRRGNFFTAQGNALGIRHLPTMRPVRATLTFHCFFIVALAGRVGRFCIRLPRAMPWAMEILGFQPVFAHTSLFSYLCKRYWFSHLYKSVNTYFSSYSILYNSSFACLRQAVSKLLDK